MTESEVIAFLRYPSAQLVDYALSLVNLTWQESLAIKLCGRQKYTQEKAAELACYSVDAMHLWYRSGIKKLLSTWGSLEWIRKIVN